MGAGGVRIAMEQTWPSRNCWDSSTRNGDVSYLAIEIVDYSIETGDFS